MVRNSHATQKQCGARKTMDSSLARLGCTLTLLVRHDAQDALDAVECFGVGFLPIPRELDDIAGAEFFQVSQRRFRGRTPNANVGVPVLKEAQGDAAANDAASACDEDFTWTMMRGNEKEGKTSRSELDRIPSRASAPFVLSWLHRSIGVHRLYPPKERTSIRIKVTDPEILRQLRQLDRSSADGFLHGQFSFSVSSRSKSSLSWCLALSLSLSISLAFLSALLAVQPRCGCRCSLFLLMMAETTPTARTRMKEPSLLCMR